MEIVIRKYISQLHLTFQNHSHSCVMIYWFACFYLCLSCVLFNHLTSCNQIKDICPDRAISAFPFCTNLHNNHIFYIPGPSQPVALTLTLLHEQILSLNNCLVFISVGGNYNPKDLYKIF